MNKAVLVFACLGQASLASAGPAPWCKGDSKNNDMGDYELQKLKSNDQPRDTIEILAKAACSTSPEVEAHRAELEKSRQAWGTKYGMNDADWADVIEYANATGYTPDQDTVEKSFARLTPIDQYQIIDRGAWKYLATSLADPMYMADALEKNLTEVGRLAYIQSCLKNVESNYSHDDDPVVWAVCQGDIDKFDLKKFYDEVRSDKQHDGKVRTWLRFKGHDLAQLVKQYNEHKAEWIKKDEEYKKVWDNAAKGRDNWAKAVGANTKLLDMVSDVESGFFYQSRKQLDGCEAKTEQALGAAIAEIPASAFKGMHDKREDISTSFGEKALPVVFKNPDVYIASIAYAECHPESGITHLFHQAMYGMPGSRGPRSGALAGIMAGDYKFDDLKHKDLSYPQFKDWPYLGSYTDASTFGGVVKSVKKTPKGLTIAFETTKMQQEDCVKEHRGRLSRIRPDGSLEYDAICDKWAMVTHDNTYPDMTVDLAYEKFIKPGMVVSLRNRNNSLMDLVATWSNKSAKTPNMVLFGTVK